MVSAGKVFQASDMNRQGKAILDAARSGEARIRDRSGTSLLLLQEEQVQIVRRLLQVASNLGALVVALGIPEDSRQDLAYGDWTWLRHLDEQDRHDFIKEMSQEFTIAAREQSQRALKAVEEALSAWRTTAEEVADPTRKAILLSVHNDDDFVEVARPVGSEPVPA